MSAVEAGAEPGARRKILKIPHPFVILTGVVALMALLTHVIPAGAYKRVTNSLGVEVLDPGSFHQVASTPVTLMQFLTSIPRGLVEAGWIVALCFFVGGAFEVISRIGLIPAMVESLANRFSSRKTMIIPVLILVFATIDAFIGTPELIVVYVPIVLPLMLRLGFDSITGVAVVLCGSAAGFSAGITNPFTIAIGQKLSGLPLYSGWEFRVVTFFITWAVAVAYVLFYARRILKDPTKSRTYEGDIEKRQRLIVEADLDEGTRLGLRQKIAGVFSLVVFAVMVTGMVSWNWDLPEMCAAFLVIGVGSALIARMDVDTMCDTLMLGAQNMMVGALVIGISRAISVVMTDGQIVDTVVHAMASGLAQLPPGITIFGVLIAVTLLNFLIPSGSGKAVVLFPILAPLADVIGVTRQTMVTTFQLGDGFTLYLWPTVGYFMAALALAGVSWPKWVRFYLPLAAIFLTLAMVYLLVAQAIHYGPF
ncbi:YfcC family protein [Mycobacterium sp. 155]|uniref:YfcC family protein n=1 Tax=Mycobacterium sp. 155 TaxID=1157943 RepID=UPI0003690BF4|nr:AbgT family transporter [Mycobacterium sp. 155]